ncbi:MAG TPA: FHA domain-containing protein [Candidatus Polarisedimenticolia bacterium]|nr:FHA domain-containing protein [Candidatus Polarisedimenticolia bacterium]
MPIPYSELKPTRLKIKDDKGFEKVVLIDRSPFPIGTEAVEGLAVPMEEGSPVGPFHAVIRREADTYVLEDRSGSCGTRVNGRPIRRTVLKHGDSITLGSSRYTVQFLVEGTRAADQHERRVKAMLALLLDLHDCDKAEDVPARAVAGILQVLSPSWVALSLGARPDELRLVTAADSEGKLPSRPTAVARQVASTRRAWFQPERLCVPLLDRADSTLLGVLDLGPRELSPYAAGDLEILEAMAGHTGLALLNAARRPGHRPARAEAAAGSQE